MTEIIFIFILCFSLTIVFFKSYFRLAIELVSVYSY